MFLFSLDVMSARNIENMAAVNKGAIIPVATSPSCNFKPKLFCFRGRCATSFDTTHSVDSSVVTLRPKFLWQYFVCQSSVLSFFFGLLSALHHTAGATLSLYKIILYATCIHFFEPPHNSDISCSTTHAKKHWHLYFG